MKKLALIATICITLALISMPLTARAAGGQSITRAFQPSSADSYVDQTNPDTTHDATATNMNVDSEAGDACRSYVKFDLSFIPQGSTITSATLSLYEYTAPSGSRDVSVHRVTGADWAEATITWSNQPAYNAGATATVASGATDGVWLNWTVTTDVNLWVNQASTNPNYGWCAKDSLEDTSPSRLIQFYTKEYTPAPDDFRPKLAVTFTAPWESYRDTGRATVWGDTGTEYDATYHIVYMQGTDFLDGTQTYNVGYYDAGGTLIATDNNISLVNFSGGRGTLGNTSSPYEPMYDFTSDQTAQASPPDWHAVAQPYGTTAFPSSYSTLSADPDTYELIADDTFTADASAIPEFPTVMAAMGVAGLCFGIYYRMRKRRLAYVKT